MIEREGAGDPAFNASGDFEARGDWDESAPLRPDFLDLIEEYRQLTDDAERSKHVYTCAGLALYWAQCFEQQLQILLLCEGKLRRDLRTMDDWDQLDAKLAKSTCGALLKEVRGRVRIDPPGIRNLDEALRLRNHIAHHFFWQNAVNFFHRAGKERMVIELASAANCFWHADKLASRVTAVLVSQLGLPVEELETYIADSMEKAEAGSPEWLSEESINAWLQQLAARGKSACGTPPS